jgi:hypothetical protein
MNVSLSQIDHMLFTSQPPSLHVVLHPTGPLNWTAVGATRCDQAGPNSPRNAASTHGEFLTLAICNRAIGHYPPAALSRSFDTRVSSLPFTIAPHPCNSPGGIFRIFLKIFFPGRNRLRISSFVAHTKAKLFENLILPRSPVDCMHSCGAPPRFLQSQRDF